MESKKDFNWKILGAERFCWDSTVSNLTKKLIQTFFFMCGKIYINFYTGLNFVSFSLFIKQKKQKT